MSPEDKATILINLHKAREVIEAVPEALLDLEKFKVERKTCNTLMCVAGWLTTHPHFAEFMELRESKGDPGSFRLHATNDTRLYVGWGWLEQHFGYDAFENLFSARGDCAIDDSHPDAYYAYGDDVDDDEEILMISGTVTDKALALWRIDQQIAKIEAW
jgi:hypothetical protein